jgi:hypothetical protein
MCCPTFSQAPFRWRGRSRPVSLRCGIRDSLYWWDGPPTGVNLNLKWRTHSCVPRRDSSRRPLSASVENLFLGHGKSCSPADSAQNRSHSSLRQPFGWDTRREPIWQEELTLTGSGIRMFERIRAYVEINPVKAELVRNPCDFPWSSAGVETSLDAARTSARATLSWRRGAGARARQECPRHSIRGRPSGPGCEKCGGRAVAQVATS